VLEFQTLQVVNLFLEGVLESGGDLSGVLFSGDFSVGFSYISID